MIKSELIKAYESEGIAIPFRMLLDIYSDDEDIPNSFIKNVLLHKPTPTPHTFVMSELMYNAFNNAIKESKRCGQNK